ncbi:acyltransferase family protein [Dyadobacter sandarakinus]|uniref:Acyltransferase n=1 Tax=Dyadobacter sandarakinus TaxID=2747268 RepID=A0ABX7ICH2_9BACT|nr:acyltransferase [Dyadobacter sandarakinus]QRR03680.1 acyltransferase [Dyadobacter sandarakinus]
MEQKPSGYIAQLDGLRAIAIVLVVLFHWFPEGQGINVIANGPLGVTLFFVLSGFLITRILLSSRSFLQSHGLAATYKNFMIRRVLRIFPLYYLTLLILWCIRYIAFIPKVPTQLYEYPLYYLLYISNFLIEKLHDWSDVLSPFWSLAVEEQFYIIWPVIILTVAPRYLRNVIISIIVTGILSRGVLAWSGYAEGVLMPTCLDAFGLGALWAYVVFFGKNAQKFLRLSGYLTWAGLILFLYICFNEATVVKTWLFRTSMSFICLYFVARASYEGGFSSVFGKILNHGSLRYIGKISYGLYVYHMLVPALVLPFLIRFLNRFAHISLNPSEAEMKIASLVLLVIVASISWYAFEAPFNGLKRHFRLSTMRRPVE